MRGPWRLLALLVGLLAAHAASVRAQDTTRTRADSVRARMPAPPHADSSIRDSLARRDSAFAQRVERDTIQPPLTRAEAPVLLDLAAYRWTRDSLWAGGVVTLADLLDRVPGATSLRVGWMAAPSAATYLGDVARVRIFMDGLELDALAPRHGSVLDLTSVQLWTLEEVRIERGATELRVYLRTWRVERTTPSTRADIMTGDQQTNLFRLFFGRRYHNGAALQAAGQQYNTRPPSLGESSDELSLMTRAGWAGQRFSVDGFVLRSSTHRGQQRSRPDLLRGTADAIPTLDAARLDAYIRGGWGDPESGPWAQVVAGALGYKMESIGTPPEGAEKLSDSTRYHAQYLVTGGVTRGAWRASAAHRVRVIESSVLHTPAMRAGWETRRLALGAMVEAASLDSTSRAELSGRLVPFSWAMISAAVGRQRDRRPAEPLTGDYARAEGQVLVRAFWLGGGVLRRGPALLEVPRIFGEDLRAADRVVDEAGTAAYVTLRGTVYRAVKADITALQWLEGESLYRPRFQTRSDLYIATTLPERFPTGNFGMLLGVRHEYRGAMLYPGAAGVTHRVSGHRTIDAMLEFRIVDAVLSYQFRNLLVEDYQLVPGFPMSRQTQYYGIRWYFWN